MMRQDDQDRLEEQMKTAGPKAQENLLDVLREERLRREAREGSQQRFQGPMVTTPPEEREIRDGGVGPGPNVYVYPTAIHEEDPHTIYTPEYVRELLAQEHRETTLPENSAERKEYPLHRGLLRYFPAALAAAARVSKIGNDKHRPGQPLGHSRGVSNDHADCILRHLIDLEECGGYDENGAPQVAYIAWRALALAQEWFEKHEGAPAAPAAEFPDA